MAPSVGSSICSGRESSRGVLPTAGASTDIVSPGCAHTASCSRSPTADNSGRGRRPTAATRPARRRRPVRARAGARAGARARARIFRRRRERPLHRLRRRTPRRLDVTAHHLLDLFFQSLDARRCIHARRIARSSLRLKPAAERLRRRSSASPAGDDPVAGCRHRRRAVPLPPESPGPRDPPSCQLATTERRGPGSPKATSAASLPWTPLLASWQSRQNVALTSREADAVEGAGRCCDVYPAGMVTSAPKPAGGSLVTGETVETGTDVRRRRQPARFRLIIVSPPGLAPARVLLVLAALPYDADAGRCRRRGPGR